MKNQLKLYLQSFKVKKDYFYTLLIDFVYWIFMVLFFLLVSFILNRQADTLAGGKTVEEIKAFLITAPPEQASAFLADMQAYLFSFFGLIILYAVIAVALFALSRALIWHYLNRKPFHRKKYFKWLLLIMVALVFFVIALVPIIILKYILFVFLQTYPTALSVIGQLVNFFYFVVLAYVFFLVCYHFTHNYQVWSAFTKTFELIGRKFKTLFFSYIFAVITSVIITLVLLLLFYLIPALQNYNLHISFVIVLLFFAWLRLYILKIIH